MCAPPVLPGRRFTAHLWWMSCRGWGRTWVRPREVRAAFSGWVNATLNLGRRRFTRSSWGVQGRVKGAGLSKEAARLLAGRYYVWLSSD